MTRVGASAGSGLARRIGHWSTHPLLGHPDPGGGARARLPLRRRAGGGDGRRLPGPHRLRGLRRALDRPARPLPDARAAPCRSSWSVRPASRRPRHGGSWSGRYGVVSMGLSYGLAIVLPIVATFFVSFSVLEDSGYLPRLAVMVNKLFRRMGLNGKAVLPDGAGARLRHHGDHDGADHGDAEGAGHRHPAPRARRPVQRADRRDPGDDRRPAVRRLGLVRARPSCSCSSWSAGSPPRSCPGAAPTSCWSSRRCASRRRATSR